MASITRWFSSGRKETSEAAERSSSLDIPDAPSSDANHYYQEQQQVLDRQQQEQQRAYAQNQQKTQQAASHAQAQAQPPSNVIELDQFEIHKKEGSNLGVGSFGSVFKATHLPTKTVCAMKVMSKAQGSFQRQYWEREATSLHRLSAAVAAGAANAPQFYGAFEDEQNFYIAMELVNGVDMFAFLEQRDKFCVPEHDAKLIIWQVLAVLANAHAVGVAHRDIKLENILVDRQTLKTTVLDFGLAGLARNWQHETLSPQHAAALPVMRQDFCGSLDYAAPEVAYKKGPYNAKLADIWSVGIVLFVLVFGITPYSRKVRYQAIRTGKPHPNILWPSTDHVSQHLVDLISNMLEVDPQHRLTLQQAVDHPWFLPATR